jgi:hypothetical protein
MSYRGIGIATAALAAGAGLYMYWYRGDGNGAREKKEDVSADEPYEGLYPIGMSVDDVRGKETSQNIENGVVEEVTPKGRLFMRYMESDDMFQYWSDKSQDYKYLEVAARKYVILFECQEKYVDMVDELVKERNRRKHSAVQNTVQSTAPPSVFATFKQYTTKDSRKIANEKANLYKWKGKLSDYAPSSDKAQQSQAQSQAPVIRYSEYKMKI